MLSLLPSSGGAATATTTMSISATVVATCAVSASPLAFGTYTGATATSTSTLTITCTNTTPYNVGLSPGISTGATVSARAMTLSTSSFLAYVLTSDAGYSINWGQTVGTDTVAGTGNGTAQLLTVYGRIAAGQYVTPGNYEDTVTVTVTF